MAKSKPPTEQEMLDYQKANPKLSGIDVPSLYGAYSATGWVDTHGKPIINWKLKLHTLSQYSPPKLCCICEKPAVKWQIRDGKKAYICNEHLPVETPRNPNPVLPKKNDEMVTKDKAQKQIKKLMADFGR